MVEVRENQMKPTIMDLSKAVNLAYTKYEAVSAEFISTSLTL